mmetsp:Transcript_11818/g.19399  ORF Transcript_11818/g.19399 Transcript_11818/m.19399 type:complete len:413 (-) Transcript_11818:69-1307(-)
MALAARRSDAVRLGAHITNSTALVDPLRATTPTLANGVAVNDSGHQAEIHGQWLSRDAAVEEEIFVKGELADTVFQCAGYAPLYTTEAVFGQASLFALLSPVLKERLFPSDDPATSMRGEVPNDSKYVKRDQQGRREISLADELTVRGFQEVARYVYRLQPKFTLSSSAEVVAAARILHLPELDRGVIAWGLAHFEALAASRGVNKEHLLQESHEIPESCVGDALRCFGVLCLPLGKNWETKYAAATAWREAMLKAFESEEISSSAAFLELSEDALLLLMGCKEMHRNPADLWDKCICWARKRKESEDPLKELPSSCGGPQFALLPRKLFVPGARLVTLSPQAPEEKEVDWQRWLLQIAEITRFQDMPAGIFAAHMDSISPMLPELRQVIYKIRRQGLAKDRDSLQKLLECS